LKLEGRVDKIFNFLTSKLEKQWHNFYSSLLLSGICILLILAAFNMAKTWCLVSLCLGSTILIIATWLISNKIPKVSKGKIGIAISLTYDQESEEKQVEVDFISSLRNLLQRDPDGANIGLVQRPG
jgi:hypothetical protein